MSNFKRVFLETMFSKRVPERISETAEPIYLKFKGLNLHEKRQSSMQIFLKPLFFFLELKMTKFYPKNHYF